MSETHDVALFVQGQEVIDQVLAEARQSDEEVSNEELQKRVTEALVETGHDPTPPTS